MNECARLTRRAGGGGAERQVEARSCLFSIWVSLRANGLRYQSDTHYVRGIHGMAGKAVSSGSTLNQEDRSIFV